MYRPDRFSKTFKQEGGQALWDFLHEPTTLLQMETAAYLGRPSIEALSPQLLKRFGGTVKRDRIKQMIGHMVRQVMEARGYHLQQGNMKITRIGNIFSRGSRFVRPEAA